MREEIFSVLERDITIEVAGNSVNSVRKKSIVKKSARIFCDGKIFSSSYIGDLEDCALVDSARKNIDSALEYNYELPEITPQSKTNLIKSKTEIELFAEIDGTLNWLKQKYPEFVFSGNANLKKTKKELVYKGIGKLDHEFDICSWSLIYRHKKSQGIIDGYFGAETICGFDIQAIALDYAPYLDSFECNVELRSGEIPVVFMNPNSLFTKVLESARADNYKREIGLFKGKLGQAILDEKFSLSDISYNPELMALDLFDAEGYIRSNAELELIKNGIFTNLICDLNNAEKYKLKQTGNSQREFDTASRLDFNSIRVKAGQRSVKEILNELPECIIVEMAAGGAFTDIGDYSTPVQNGFLVRYGKIIGKVPQVTLLSSVGKMFGSNLIEIAKDAISSVGPNPAIFSKMNVLMS
ncbi:MAG: hypothetical protein KBD78_11970 [Oligoflexales bacterium]|nr:hypothetical protein [Oligoflexales bacterium]